ncbi:1,3-beta-glucanosyltransferase [Pleurostoma richardsiae]|uniref:1,3-beta-glucanosyltransferase n=1 Tax=Pleurostoma richardsiae TaxID=41990 RepID=A0AA38VME0_9PEZI|nr:1,3-beta-glucanosyltransferase [Pleurostoma richardsiae]
MKSFVVASLLAGLALAKPTPTEKQAPHKRSSLPTVTASGNAFWAGSDRFYVRGIDYQPGGSSDMSDPLADEDVCKRDITEFKKLGINTIRVYITDNSADHDTCMNALADAGIYVILDANNPLYSINRDDPAPSYNAVYLQSVFATIDEFIQYDNTLAFFSGNEVVNDKVNTTLSAKYVKATTRDMRQYISKRGYRSVPVGYSAADVAQNRMQLAHYMNCGTDDVRSDFFAFNDYSWCNTDFTTSGWDVKVKNFTGYGIPLFISEYGCTTNGRDFGEVEALMSDEMTFVYSGGLLYEYSKEDNDFGIVTIDGTSVDESDDFTKYASALSANPAPTGDGGFTSTTNSVACPTADSEWLIDTTALPAIPAAAEKYMTEGAGTGPGLTGDGSQNAGSEDGDGATSTGDVTAASGSVSATATGESKAGITHVGPFDKTPLVLTGLVFCLSLFGTLLL